MSYPAPPDSFLSIHVHDISKDPTICALCAGYEGGKWRAEALADHAMEWLPEFCLAANEFDDFGIGKAFKLVRKAAQLVYQTDKYRLRGEFGELFLHIAVRQVHNSIPAISKIYWKDSVNSTVKGYDAVHVVETSGKLELWLGEVKFYTNASQAIRDVVAEIKDHTEISYMKKEVALIANKLDKNSKYYTELSRLLDPNTSLDEVFDAACIPVLITYDSDALKDHRKTTLEYKNSLLKEVTSIHEKFKKKIAPLSLPLKIHLFLIPLNSKKEIISIMDKKLKGFQ